MLIKTKWKSYNQLIRLPTFEERFHYLKIGGLVGRETFGFDRYLSQSFYQSREWKHIRNKVLLRDNGCDLGDPEREIFAGPVIHHINPITIEDLEEGNDLVFDLNNLITTTHNTHNAIHYGSESLLVKLPRERTKGDTTPWLI